MGREVTGMGMISTPNDYCEHHNILFKEVPGHVTLFWVVELRSQALSPCSVMSNTDVLHRMSSLGV